MKLFRSLHPIMQCTVVCTLIIMDKPGYLLLIDMRKWAPDCVELPAFLPDRPAITTVITD